MRKDEMQVINNDFYYNKKDNDNTSQTINESNSIVADRIPKSNKKIPYDRRKNKTNIVFSERRKNERRNINQLQNEQIINIDKRKIELANYTKEYIDKRRKWLGEKTKTELNNISYYSLDVSEAKGNIENMIGVAQIPIGVAGPLKINGDFAKDEFYIPLATTEGALVMTYQRGMMAINLAGGANVKILKNQVHISPVFLLNNLKESFIFGNWIKDNFDNIKKEAESTTDHGKLLSIERKNTGNSMILVFHYSTGDAAGQNMITFATEAACNYIRKQTGVNYFLKSNFSSDKKTSFYNYIQGYGRSVLADVSIPSEVLQKVFYLKPKEVHDLYQNYVKASTLAGMVGLNSHYANGLSALFIACGQDAAHIANSHSGMAFWECTHNDTLYLSVYLSSLVIGTVGGGTHLGTQKECLKILDCYGTGKANKFAEIAAALALAGELSIGSSLANGSFAKGHFKHGRNKI